MISDSVRGLDSGLFEQKIYTGECENGEADYLQTHGQDLEAIIVTGLGRKINLKGDVSALFALIKAIRQEKPDIIHTHASKAGLLGRTAAILSVRKVKLVHTYHGHILFGYFGRIKSLVFVFIERLLAKKTNVLIAVGHKVSTDLLAAKIGTVAKYAVIYPGVVQPTAYSMKFAQEKLDLNIPEGNLVCAYFGRVTNIKRPDRFLEIVQLSLEKSLTVSFFIAGEGDLSQTIKDQINEIGLPIKWLGWQTDVGMIMSALDILVICSDNEGLPLSAIEAGYMSKIVVGTNVGSIPEIVSDKVTGFITEKNSFEVVDVLDLLIKNPLMREEMGAAAKRKIENNFTLSKSLSEISRLYIDLSAS